MWDDNPILTLFQDAIINMAGMSLKIYMDVLFFSAKDGSLVGHNHFILNILIKNHVAESQNYQS